VPFADGTKAPDLGRHTAYPLQEIQVVRALVQEDAAALSSPGRPPASGRVIGIGAEPIRDDPTDPQEPAQLAVFYHLLNLDVMRVRALVEHSGKDQALVLVCRTFVRCDQSLAIRLVHGYGLFYHYVVPRLKGRNPDGGMGIVRGGDQYCVAHTIVQQRLRVKIRGAPPPLAGRFGPFGYDVAHCRQFNLVAQCVDVWQVQVADIPYADQR
jgi:hypothetical protein